MAYISFQPNDYFNTKLWTGTGAENAITGVGFQPDWVWIKNRDAAEHNKLYDAVRGANKVIYSNLTNAEATVTQDVKSFDSNGFTLGTESAVNASGQDIVGWNWKAGTSFTNDASATGIGTIDSTGSVNQDAGFSIVSYTGNATDNASVKHGLNTAPKMVIIKDLSDTSSWGVWHQNLTNGGYKLTLNSTDAQADDTSFIGGSNRAIPTSSVFFLGGGGGGNGTNANIAYCFSEVKGYSKFGSYTGNGSTDGPFVYTGFKPAFVLVKNTSAANNWFLQDSKRLGYNGANHLQKPNTNGADDTGTHIDMLSNGFKTIVSSANCNGSGNTMIYMAFAEAPLVSSNGVPAVAR